MQYIFLRKLWKIDPRRVWKAYNGHSNPDVFRQIIQKIDRNLETIKYIYLEFGFQ